MLSSLNALRGTATTSSSSGEASSPSSVILSELDRRTKHHSRSSEYVVGADAGSLPVNGDRLLKVRGPDHEPAVPLDATRLSPSAVLMASPDAHNDLSTVVNACIHNRIGLVVDLTPENSVTAALFSGDKPWTESYGASRQVEVKPLAPKILTKDPEVFGYEASETRLDLRAEEGALSASQEVNWIRLPGVPKLSLPDALLGICRRLKESELEGVSVAFMDRHGGSLAATFAAANAIFRSHVRHPLTPSDATDEVVKACALQRMARSHDLYERRPDLLEALEKFTQLLIQQGTSLPTRLSSAFAPGKLPAAELDEFLAAADDPQRVPELGNQVGAQPKRSALKQPESIYETAPVSRPIGPRKPIAVDQGVKVSHFNLFQTTQSTDRVGDEGELDDRDDKPKTRKLEEKIKSERNPHVIGDLRKRQIVRELAMDELQGTPDPKKR